MAISARTLIQPLGLTNDRRRRVLGLALPAVGEQLLNTAVGLSDIFFIGNLSVVVAAGLGYTNATAIAGAGLGNQMVWLVTVMFIALGVGSTALVSRSIGAKDTGSLRRAVHQSFLLGGAIGLVMSLVSFVIAEPFLRLINAAPESIPLGVSYIHIIAFSFFPAALLFTGNACLRGAGDTRTPLFVMLGVNGANILLTWAMVNGNLGLPALGVVGAAVGTALSRGAGGFIIAGLLIRGHSGLQLPFSLRLDLGMLRRLANISLPSAGEQMVFQLAIFFFVRFINDVGAVAYAAHVVTISIESLSFLPGMGYAAASSTLVGQALGAQQRQRAEGDAYEALWQGGLMMTSVGLLMVFFPRVFLGFFVNDPAVIEAAVMPLRAAGLVQPALAVSFIVLGALRGAGDTRFPLYSRLVSTWVIRLPLTTLLVGMMGAGLAGIWLAMCTDFTVQAMLALWRFNSRRWQRMEV